MKFMLEWWGDVGKLSNRRL